MPKLITALVLSVHLTAHAMLLAPHEERNLLDEAVASYNDEITKLKIQYPFVTQVWDDFEKEYRTGYQFNATNDNLDVARYNYHARRAFLQSIRYDLRVLPFMQKNEIWYWWIMSRSSKEFLDITPFFAAYLKMLKRGTEPSVGEEYKQMITNFLKH